MNARIARHQLADADMRLVALDERVAALEAQLAQAEQERDAALKRSGDSSLQWMALDALTAAFEHVQAERDALRRERDALQQQLEETQVMYADLFNSAPVQPHPAVPVEQLQQALQEWEAGDVINEIRRLIAAALKQDAKAET